MWVPRCATIRWWRRHLQRRLNSARWRCLCRCRSRLVELLLETLHEPPLSDIEAAWDREIGLWLGKGSDGFRVGRAKAAPFVNFGPASTLAR